MAELLEKDAATWSQFVTDFDGAYRAFAENRTALISQQQYVEQQHPELLSQYRAMVTRADELAPKLAALKSVRDTVAGWLSSIGAIYQRAVDATSVAIDGAAGLIASARRALGLGQLGIVPIVIGVGVAAAALAAVVKWIADCYLFAKRINMLRDLEAKGYSPQQATAYINGVMGKPEAGLLERAGTQLMWIVGLGLLVAILGPRLLEMHERGRKS